MLKQLIACPNCENNGRRYILGELAPTGHILVQRTHGRNGEYRNYTIIGGNDFYIICDNCAEKIYFKKVERRNNESLNFGSIGIHWSTFKDPAGTIGTHSISA